MGRGGWGGLSQRIVALWLVPATLLCLSGQDVGTSDTFFLSLLPNAGHGLLILEVSRSHTITHHSRQDSSAQVIDPSERPLPNKTHHPQQEDIHVAGGIRTHNLSKRAVADP